MKVFASALLLQSAVVAVAPAEPAARTAAVDGQGVLRWQDDNSEVALFGVNYYVPFSIDYRVLADRGLDHERAIRDDVTHFVRLGLDAIRLHCFDRDFSDREGNLKDNDHLRLLDLLIAECAKHGIYSVMTPIAWWGSPQGGEGFSDVYSMHEMTTDPQAWAAQCTYLTQFMNHVNRFTGRAYKDDPAIVAIELINEPICPPGTTTEVVTEYINTLTRAVRATGSKKPIFFNCWGGRAEAAAKSELDGVSFGWYPTGLVAGRMLTANYLPRVDDYPAMRDERLATKAKIVYEFDAADVHSPYLYPAMARAFRSGGAQIATQFQYEPLCIADGNPNWQTHYLNLVYTPGKAMSFAIAAEAFRQTPRLARFGSYPQSARFGDFRVSYENGLSEYATRDAFMYSGDTKTPPPAPAELTRVWGCGSSPVVEYEGTGAYFFDRVKPGVWELQVYPDAVMVADPYTGGTHEKMRVLWQQRAMTVRLPDLGAQFHVTPVGEGATRIRRTGETMQLTPGHYLLTREPIASPEGIGRAPAFLASPSSEAPPAVFLARPERWREGYPLDLRASVAATDVEVCTLHLRTEGQGDFAAFPCQPTRAYEYLAAVPREAVVPGEIEYFLSVRTAEETLRFPGGEEWDGEPLPQREPIAVLALAADTPVPTVKHSCPEGVTPSARLVAGRDEGSIAVRVEAERFGEPPSCAAVRFAVPQPKGDLTHYTDARFVVRGSKDTSGVEVGFVQDDGNAFGPVVPLSPQWNEVIVPLKEMRALWQTKTTAPDPARINEISLIFGSWLFPEAADLPHWIEVQSVALVHQPEAWTVDVASRDDPVLLVEPARRHVKLNGHPGGTRIVPGMDPGRQALRVSVAEFTGHPDSTSFRLELEPGTKTWSEEMTDAKRVLLKARAARSDTNRLEIVLLERDGSPWGTNIELADEWQTLAVPLSNLRYFAHWGVGPKDRGGEGDHVHPESIRQVNFCFGAWLYGDKAGERHAFDVQDVSLAK